MSFRCSGFFHLQAWLSIKKIRKFFKQILCFLFLVVAVTHIETRFMPIGQSKSTRRITLKHTNTGFRTSYRKLVRVRFEPKIFLFSGFPHNLFRYLPLLNLLLNCQCAIGIRDWFRVNLLYQFIFCKVITNIHKILSSRK